MEPRSQRYFWLCQKTGWLVRGCYVILKLMKKFWRVVMRLWRPTVAYGLGLSLLSGLLLFRLGSLAGGLSAPEVAARTSASSWRAIVENPMFTPYKLVEYLVLRSGWHSPTALRLVSMMFAMLIAYGFYRILRTWYTWRMAVFGTILFATSAWFLHTARLATPDIMYLGAIGLVWCGLRLHTNRQRPWTLLICSVIISLLLYVPGLVWFIVPTLVWQRKLLFDEFAAVDRWLAVVLIALITSLMTPLLLGIVQHPILLKPLLGLPDHLPAWHTIISNLVLVPKQLFIHHQVDPVHWLAQVPLLDIFSIAMLVMGLYNEFHARRLDRVRLLAGLLVGGSALVTLAGPVPVVFVLPFIYLVITSGITLMLQQWFTVFPRNPVARGIGLSLMLMAIALSCTYQLRHYFIAWPHAAATRQVFSQRS